MNRIKTTTLYLPADAEKLLQDTILATVFDDRGVSILCLNAPWTPRGRESSETAVEYASRAWQEILPGPASGALALRLKYGWSAEEINQITYTLRTIMETCALLAAETKDESVRSSLLWQRERLWKLQDQWREHP